QAGRPVNATVVQASGPGRIFKRLKNTITSGTTVTTAPIRITESASISGAKATLIVTSVESASLVTPNGTVLPMAFVRTISGTGDEFVLTTASAGALIAQPTAGNWSFRVAGSTSQISGRTIRLSPSVVSGLVNFE